MLRKILAIFIALSIIFSPFTITSVKANTTAGVEFYVATTGNDSNTGTIDSPFKTLEKARDAIRSLKEATGLPEGGVTVYLRGGTYQRTDSFIIEAQDSGTADKPIVYQAYPGEAVSVSGGINLDKSWFTPVTDTALKNRIVSEDARKKVLMADLRSHGINDYGEISRHGYWKANDVSKVPPMELYMDGKRMTLARWPNNSTVQMGDIVDPGPKQGEADLQTRGGTFKYGYDRPKYWTQATDIWADGIFGYSWEWSYNKVAQIDTVKKEITLGYGEMSRLNKNWYPDFHFFENLFEEIDMPGEYYIDRTNGILYLLPTATFINGTPELTVAMLNKPMLVSDSASYVSFKDLTLEYGRDCAAQITGGSNVIIAQCEISNFTNSGVLINSKSRFLYDVGELPTDGKNHGVIACHIHNIGGTAVTLSGGNMDTLEKADNFVENSHIHDFAYYHKAYNPGILLSGVANRASHNKLHDAPHPGILIFGNEHLVEYNDISNVCTTFSDLGAIYMNEGETPQHSGTVIRRNYFHNIGEHKEGVQGVYPDNYTFGVTIEDNIFYKMGNAAINNNSGSYIITQNNMFIDCKMPYNNSDYFQDGNQVQNFYMPKWEELFSKYNNFQGMPHLKYPQLTNFFGEERVLITSNTYKNNLIYNPTLPLSPTVKKGDTDLALGAFDKFNLLQASGNWLTQNDPGFVNLAVGDFNLKGDAAIYTHIPEFKAIPFNEIGLTGKVGPTSSTDNIGVTNVYFSNEEGSVDIAKTFQLQTEIVPWNATNQKLHYSVSNPDIASVDENGIITGHVIGNVTVTVTSDENPSIMDTCSITVNTGDGILHNTDFENGANGWGVDANHPIEVDASGNHWYKILKGANSQLQVDFSDYVLEFKLKTPATIPNGVFFMIYERANESGTGRIGYFVNSSGVPRWDIMDNSWTVLSRNTDVDALQPDTIYNMKVLAKGKEISIYVNDRLIVKATNPNANISGKVGFYVENFDFLMFDDIKFSIPTIAAESITLDYNKISLNEGKQTLLHATVLPENAADKSIVWSSSDHNVATVDESGFVSALRLGQADIIAALAVNPNIKVICRVTVSDDIHFTDFEPGDEGTGANGWGVDINHPIEADDNNNHWYKLVNGASTKSPIDLSNYILEFKLKTPATIPNGVFFMIYDRENTAGTGRIGYFVNNSGAPRWDIMSNSWSVIKTNPDVSALEPNTEYNIKVIAVGTDISVYVNDNVVVQGSNPGYNPSGKVGFYVENFDNLMFDDIRFSLPRKQVDSLSLSEHTLSVEAGDMLKLGVTINPTDATNRRVAWSSSDSGKVSVDQEGNITALAPGDAIITVTSEENEAIKDTCTVHVDPLNYVSMPIDSMLQIEKNWTPYNMFKVENNAYEISSAGAVPGSLGAVGYTAAKFSNEVFKFKAKLDFGGMENSSWYGFSMRSEQPGKVIWSGIKGYLIVVKKEQIELQRWNPGTTMLKVIPNNNQIIIDGKEHLFEVGVVKKGEDNKIYFKVDDTIVLNYVDKGVVNPVPDSGYLSFLSFNNGEKTMRISSLEDISVELDPARDNSTPAPVLVAPINLALTGTTGSAISLSWEAADETEIAGYKVLRDGNQIAETTTPSFIDVDLQPGVTYTYTVKAFDSSGNESPESLPLTVKCEMPATELKAPVNLIVTGTTGSSISLSWEPGDIGSSIAGYRVYRDGSLVAETTTPSFIDINLQTGLTYTYTVKAFDALGNESPASTPVTVKLEAEPSTPPPSNNSDSQDSTPVPNISVVGNGDVIITVATKLNATSGNAASEITKQVLTQAFERAVEGLEGIKNVSIELQETNDAKGYSLKLPSEFLVSDNKDKEVQIKTPLGTVIISNNMFNGRISSDVTSVELVIRAANISKIDSELKEKVSGKPVIEISTMIAGKEVAWNNPTAPVTVYVPYKPTAEELKEPEFIVVWYLDDSGKAIPVTSGTYNASSEQVEFKTTHFSKYAIAYQHITFSDTQNVSWAKKAIEILASKGIIPGASSTAYTPNTELTRAEFLSYLIRGLGLNAEVTSNFEDIRPEDDFYNEIGIAKQLGITSGTGGNKFSPDLLISRQDMMVLTEKALRIAGKIETKGKRSDLKGFGDIDEISPYALNSVAILVKESIIYGTGGKISPLEYVTKAQAAAMIYNIYNK